METLKGYGEGKNNEMGGTIISQCFCVLTKVLRYSTFTRIHCVRSQITQTFCKRKVSQRERKTIARERKRIEIYIVPLGLHIQLNDV